MDILNKQFNKVLHALDVYQIPDGFRFTIHPTLGASYNLTDTVGNTLNGLTVGFSTPSDAPVKSEDQTPITIEAIGGDVYITLYGRGTWDKVNTPQLDSPLSTTLG